jgi:hypothetical protein
MIIIILILLFLFVNINEYFKNLSNINNTIIMKKF